MYYNVYVLITAGSNFADTQFWCSLQVRNFAEFSIPLPNIKTRDGETALKPDFSML